MCWDQSDPILVVGADIDAVHLLVDRLVSPKQYQSGFHGPLLLFLFYESLMYNNAMFLHKMIK